MVARGKETDMLHTTFLFFSVLQKIEREREITHICICMLLLPFKGKRAACQSHCLHHYYHHCCQSQTKSSLHLNCQALQKSSWIRKRKLKRLQSNQIIIKHILHICTYTLAHTHTEAKSEGAHTKIMLIPLKNIWHTKLNKRSRKQAAIPANFTSPLQVQHIN